MLVLSRIQPRAHQSLFSQICHEVDLSLTRKQRPAISITNRPVMSISRSMGTTTWMADVKKIVDLAKSSPPKKGEKNRQPSATKQQVLPVHAPDAYFTVKTHKGEVRRVTLSPMYTSQ